MCKGNRGGAVTQGWDRMGGDGVRSGQEGGDLQKGVFLGPSLPLI